MQPRKYPGAGLVLAGVAPALVVPCLASLFYFVICRDSGIARWIYAGAKVFLVVWPLLWWMVARPPRSMHRRRGPAWWRVGMEGLLSGLAMAGVVWAVMQTSLGARVYAESARIGDRVEHLGVGGFFVLFVVVLSLVHSLVEEYYWRWFVFGRLRTFLTRWPAAVLASLGFASHHVVVTSQLLSLPLGFVCGAGVFLAGLVWSALYDRHRTLLGVWLSHVVVDAAVFAVGWQVLRAAGAQ